MIQKMKEANNISEKHYVTDLTILSDNFFDINKLANSEFKVEQKIRLINILNHYSFLTEIGQGDKSFTNLIFITRTLYIHAGIKQTIEQ